MNTNTAAAVLFALGLVPFVIGVFHMADNGYSRIGVNIFLTGAIFMAPAILKLWFFVLFG